MNLASAVIYRMPRSDLRILKLSISADQAIVPADEGVREYRSQTRAQVDAIMQEWRDRGYVVEWRVGGYRE